MSQPKPLFGLESIPRHKRLLGLGCALGLLLGLLYAGLRPTTYTSSIELLVYNRQIMTGHDAVILPGSVDIPLLQNQIEILSSRTVLAKVIRALDLTNDPEYHSHSRSIFRPLKELILPSPVQLVDDKTLSFVITLESLRRKLKIRRVGTSHVVQIRFTASEPEKAVRIANQVAQVYLQERTRLLSEALAIREVYQGLGPSANIISEVEPPTRPDGPSKLLIALGAALLGLAGGVIVAILRDALNNTVRNPEQLEHFLGLRCLGCVPLCDSETTARSKKQERRISNRQRHSTRVVALALRRVMAAIQEPCSPGFRSLGVTSAVSGEGATTIAVNLARLMTLSGKRVLLISRPDARIAPRTSLAQEAGRLPLGSDEGIGSLGSGAAIDAGGGLHVLPLGDADTHSTGPQPLGEYVRKALNSYDFVIMDFPCLVSGARVRAAADALDGFLLVVKCGGTDCELTRQALQFSGEAQAKFIGAVLNMADEATITRYGDKSMAADDASTVTQRRPAGRTLGSPPIPSAAVDE